MQLAVAARTDVGMIRSGNEDNLFANPSKHPGLFAVADGMGGHAAGEVASKMAVEIIVEELAPIHDPRDPATVAAVIEALQQANRRIYDRTLSEADKQGMGTTASVLLLGNNRYLIGQVGDSRVYLLRDGVLQQLTKDHSYVQEQVDAGYLTPEQARYHPYSNVITRCVGASDDVEPDTYLGGVQKGDIYLVASDGLTGMVDDTRIQAILLAKSGPGRMVDALINEANGRGGLDNITAIVVQVSELDDDDDLPPSLADTQMMPIPEA
ncbi:MAG: Stp1/IreP family PP2C-type Ser/Thr phosphatase [Gemmatimonadaceae bacterium]